MMQPIVGTGVHFRRMFSAWLALAAVAADSMAQTRTLQPIVDVKDSITSNGAVLQGMNIPANRIRLNADGVVSEMAVATLSQLLSGRFAGVQVLTPGATGMASRIRIRGQSSLVLNNEPLIVVDGVRLFESMSATSNAILSRVDDININDIASIDLLSGPAGTAMYGGGAANGVVNITTKRGVPGRARVYVYGEGGLISDPSTYPDQWALWGKRGTNTSPTLCTLGSIAAGTCKADSLTHGSVLRNKSATPIDRGYRSRYGAQVSGGVAKFQYFVAAERDDETGVFKMPTAEVERLRIERGASSIPGNQVRPSGSARNSLRANVSFRPLTWMSVDVASAYVNGDARFVASENTSAGIWASVSAGPWIPDAKTSTGVPLAGYYFYPAGDIMSQSNSQSVDRYLNNISASMDPLSWLSVHGSFAKDDATQDDQFLTRKDEGPVSGERRGRLNRAHIVLSNAALTASATASFSPKGWIQTATTFGAQGIKTEYSDSTHSVFGLLARSTTSDPNAIISTTSSRDRTRSNAYFLTEALAIGNRFFLTGGVRRETPTVYGVGLDAMTYGNVGASWLISDHEFLKRSNWVDLLRLRSAYGTSGRPASKYLLAYLNPTDVPSQDVNRPYAREISAELEGGFDVSLRGNTSQISMTFYNKRTRDAVVSYPYSFSTGGPIFPTKSGALIQNRGFELSAQQQLINSGAFNAAISITGSRNRNRVLKFPEDSPPVLAGNRTTIRSLPSYPLFGLWGRPYSYTDANNDGIIVASELTIPDDTIAYLGSSFPTNEIALTPTVTFLNGKLRIAAQIDSKWGFKKFNNTLRSQCLLMGCRAVTDKSASLDDQAKAVAMSSSANILTGFIEDGSFTRFREASIAYSLPVRWARVVRSSEWNVVLTGRNLGVSTSYSGIDPEAVASSSDTHADEYFATPPMRYWVLKMNFRF